jgi:hypothetical protein
MKRITSLAKSLAQILITVASIFIFFPQVSRASEPLYIGFETSMISGVMSIPYTFQNGYGKNVYFTNPLIYEVFVGYKFDNGLGIELGYGTQRKRRRISMLEAGDSLPGRIPLENDTVIFIETAARTETWQALLRVDLQDFRPKNNIKLWGQVGVSYSRIRAVQDILAWIDDSYTELPTTRHQNGDTLRRTFRNERIIPVAKIGIDYDVTESLGIRASAGWRNLEAIRSKSKESPDSKSEIRLKNGYTLSLGFFYRF